MGHRWSLVDGEWFIICDEKQKDFDVKLDIFQKEGRCPYCKKDARNELEMKKRVKEERERQKRMKEAVKQINTLGGWF